LAHLALAIDCDHTRRREFSGRVQKLFGDLPHATIHTAEAGDLTCVWGCSDNAPVSVHRNADSLAILIGYAIDDAGTWLTAQDLAARWRDPAAASDTFDGYHLGLVYDSRRGLVTGIDPFGLFPLYFAELGAKGDSVLLASSTPEAIAAHPRFCFTIDRLGLAGILFGHGLMDNRALLAGVRRVATGHQLRWTIEKGSDLVETYHPIPSPPPADESPADLRERIGAEFLRAIRRHRPGNSETSMLLSGGLDSRLVAASLVESGIPTRALILGEPGDHEVIAGSSVATQLGLTQQIIPTESSRIDFTSAVRETVRFGHLSSAPSPEDFAEGLALASSPGRYFWSGMLLDRVFQPLCFLSGRDQAGGWSFERLVWAMNRWGVARARLVAMLGNDGRELVDAVVAQARVACMSGRLPPPVQSALVRWDQRIRNHIGSVLHRTTFNSWPLLPGNDRQLVESILGLPPTAYQGRGLEADILTAMRPDLSRIPVDGNSFSFLRLSQRQARLGRVGRLISKVDRHLRAYYWLRMRGFDPRRYSRLFNIDHPRWRDLRRTAEPSRSRLYGMLDAFEVDRILPKPEAQTRFSNPIDGGSPIRLLTGLALWADRPHLAAG
jgi:asparagine synthase (glutamine-hydrolysing)